MLDGGDKKKVVGSYSLAATPAGKQGGRYLYLYQYLHRNGDDPGKSWSS